MSNRLSKLAITSYTPGVAYQPAVPAYCVTHSHWVPDSTVIAGYTPVKVGSGINNSSGLGGTTQYVPYYKNLPAHWEYTTTCYPAKPEVKGVPASTSYTAINGWNGGARSVATLRGDGYVKFNANARPIAMVVGISSADASTLPSEQSHAFYIHGTTVDLMEFGQVVAASVMTHAAANEYRITRSGEEVTWSVGDWSRVSDTPSAGEIMLDASLYTSGDYVDNPAVVPVTEKTASLAGSLPALIGVCGDTEYAFIVGSLPALNGEAAENSHGRVAGSLAALDGLLYDRPYAQITGSLSALSGTIEGGYPQAQIAAVVGALAPLAGVMMVKSGTVASLAGALGALAGLVADRPYSEVSGSLGALEGMASSGWPVENEMYFSSGLVLMDVYRPDQVAGGYFSSGLIFGSGVELVPLIEGYFASTLLLGDRWTSEYAAEGYFSSSLRFGGAASGSVTPDRLSGQLAAEPAQYAVNVQTGALTQYTGFAFLGFAMAGQTLYACRHDGVYRIRSGDDDGQPMQALIDFGASDYGSSQVKRLEAVYFGLETDAQVTMRVASDSGEHAYPVTQIGPMARAVTAKGASGRLWNMVLEIEDATHFELDAIEAQVGATARRLGRR